jgi:hypothetical protein
MGSNSKVRKFVLTAFGISRFSYAEAVAMAAAAMILISGHWIAFIIFVLLATAADYGAEYYLDT